jgi:peptidoglycan/LPS O-acetylase OafA/YrhL
MATGPVVRDTLRTAPVDTARADPELVSRVPYLPGLDGLRALAVVAVMIYHANPSWLPGGFLGVEVFFVISGYLITLLLIAERERTGRVALGQFWMRRARRLLPALFVTLFMVVSYTALFRTDALGQIRGDVVASLFYVTNWYQIWVGQGYTASGDFAPLRHLWSLAVEEQFYLVWPLVMAALLRVGPRRVTASARWLLLAAIAVTAVIATAYHPGRIASCDVTAGAYFEVGQRCISKADSLYLSTITRSGGLLLGAALAMVWRPGAIMRSPMRSKGSLLDVLGVLGLAGLAAMTWWVHFMTPDGADPVLFRGGFFVTSLLTLLVIAAVTHRRARAGAVLGNPLFLWVGTRSYGLYLYHWPIYQMIREVAGNRLTPTEFAGAMAVTVVITELSYRFIETPIRRGQVGHWWRGLRRSRDPRQRRMVLAAAAACMTLGLFSTVSLVTAEVQPNEIAQSLRDGESATIDLEDLVDEPETTDAETEPASPVGTAPSIPEATTAPTVAETTLPPEPIPYLAIGDSVMLGAAQALTSLGIKVDAEESRQLPDMVPVVQQLRDDGVLGVAVVVHLGTNGIMSQDSLNQFMDALAAVPNVLVLTVKGDIEGRDRINGMLRDLGPGGANARGNVILVDWEVRSAECVDNCFARDGIHLSANGTRFYAALIAETLGITPA